VTVLACDGERWLVGPYGNVAWAKNARACGRVTLSRRGYRETMIVREVDAATAAPILKAYVAIEPITRRAFRVDPEAPVADWEEIAPNHPVFRLEPLSAEGMKVRSGQGCGRSPYERSFGSSVSTSSYPSDVSIAGLTCSRIRRKTCSLLYGLGR
jgi:hypothetical protein